MEPNIKSQIETLAEKFSNFPKETNFNNKKTNQYFNNTQRSKFTTISSNNSTLKDSVTHNRKNSNLHIQEIKPHHHKKSSSKVFYFINNGQLQNKFEIFCDPVSTKKNSHKIPAKDLNNDDSLEEIDTSIEDDKEHLENFHDIVDLLDFYELFMKNFDSFMTYLSKSKENLSLIEKWFDKKLHIKASGEIKIMVEEINKMKLVFFGAVVISYELIKNNKSVESRLYSEIYNNLKTSLNWIFSSISVILKTNSKENESYYIDDYVKLKIKEKDIIDTVKNDYPLSVRNRTILLTLQTVIGQMSEYYLNSDKFNIKQDKHLNFDLKNIEYLFYTLKNIKTVNFSDVSDSVYNDIFLGNLVKQNLDFSEEDLNSGENETECSNTLPPLPFLPPIEDKYTYTLVLDLDETLVHYIEEDDEAYVQVRPFAEYFLNDMSNYFEIVIFTAATEEVKYFLITSMQTLS